MEDDEGIALRLAVWNRAATNIEQPDAHVAGIRYRPPSSYKVFQLAHFAPAGLLAFAETSNPQCLRFCRRITISQGGATVTDLSLASHDELQDLDFSTHATSLQENSTSVGRNAIASLVPAAPRSFSFDYSDVSPAVAEEAEATAERIRNRHRASIIDTGNDLVAIKDKLAHGSFAIG